MTDLDEEFERSTTDQLLRVARKMVAGVLSGHVVHVPAVFCRRHHPEMWRAVRHVRDRLPVGWTLSLRFDREGGCHQFTFRRPGA